MGRLQFFDSHIHLDGAYDCEIEPLMDEARRAGVGGFLHVAVRPRNWPASIALAAAHDDVHLALGIHPQAIVDLEDIEIEEALAELPSLLIKHGAVAVGEIGLDHLQDTEDFDRGRQLRVFEAQLDIASDLKLPPLLHVLKAHDQFLRTWRNHACHKAVPGVLHSYSGSAELVGLYTEFNLFVSFSGAVTWGNARRAPAACKATPDHRLLLETDAPYQAPHPSSGAPNRPSRIGEVARHVATLRGCRVDDIARLTWDNAQRLFFGAHPESRAT